jgi:peroxiredoxin
VLLGQQPVDTNLRGPGIGTAVPAFSGRDQHGKTQTLDTVMGDEGLMLVFFRSADW